MSDAVCKEAWLSTTLGEVVIESGGVLQTGPFGSQLHASDYSIAGTPLIMPTNLGDNVIREDGIARVNAAHATRLRRHALREGDIVFSRRGDVGRRSIVRQREAGWLCGTGCLAAKLGPRRERVNPEFVAVYLGLPSVQAWMLDNAVGGTMPNLNTSILSSTPVQMPERAVQDAIISALNDASSLLVALERLVAKKQAIKQGRMQQLLTGATRLPGFNKQWQRQRIQDVLAPRTERNALRESLDVLSCTKHRGFVRSLDFFKNQVFSRDLSNYLLIYRGDIGYPANHVEEGSIGVQEVVDRGLVSPIYVVMSALDGNDTYFLQRQLKLESFRQEFARVTNASVNRRGSLRWKEFSQIRILVPPQSEQRAISTVLRDTESEIAILQARLTKAKAIKQGMMQELLTGRTRLPLKEGTA